MRDFALAYPYFPFLQAPLAKIIGSENVELEPSILQAPLAKLSWYHHITLLDKVKDPLIRTFYIEKTIENGWSRDVMVHQIEGALHTRQGQLPTNFKNTLPAEQSELVQQIFKDPYKFEFIFLGKEAKERDLENALTEQITKFLLELLCKALHNQLLCLQIYYVKQRTFAIAIQLLILGPRPVSFHNIGY